MKRLLRISLDTLIASLSSILIWFILSITIDEDLINIFTLTFPIQYISSILVSIFATGANISKENGNKNDVMSGIFYGIIFILLFLIIFLFNVDSYIEFMKYSTDKLFVIYSVIQIALHTILKFVQTKLYYQDKNKLANNYSIIFYLLNLICIILTSVLISNSIFIVAITILILSIFTIYILIKNSEKFKLKFNILKWIKYDAVTLTDCAVMCLIYLFGLSNTVNFGEQYILALTFVALITDTQWDIANSIGTVAKIDISKNKFNYKEHLNNAKKLIYLLIFSVFIMFVLMFKFYNLNLTITLIFILFHIIDFIIAPYYDIETYYLQLEYSTKKATSIMLKSRIVRLLLSFLKTPFCTVIAQTSSSVYQMIYIKVIFAKNYKIDKDGYVIKNK